MPSSEKNRTAAEAMERWVDFQEGLSSDKRGLFHRDGRASKKVIEYWQTQRT
jgi:hypothetical protein